MVSPKHEPVPSHSLTHTNGHFSIMLKLLNKNLGRLSCHLRWPLRLRSKSKLRFGKPTPKPHTEPSSSTPEAPPPKPIRIATFNAALFSMAPVLPEADKIAASHDNVGRAKSLYERPRSILKQSQSPLLGKSKLRVSINLPDNEISLRQASFTKHERKGSLSWSWSFGEGVKERQRKTVVEVLRDLNADVLGLQDVKAEEENGMKPLSDLAQALGMNYVFAESWAPQYGNAVLSKWPIKRWKLQKIFDKTDFRNVLKATIDVPQEGELHFYCTHLDHLDENWRMKQINAIIQSNDEPHILAGGLNSLDESDYSQERWTDIVKYYEEMGKPTPKVEVMKYLKSRHYTDAKDFAGECESVVMIAKGQRTSDHHIVKVDVVKVNSNPQENLTKKQRQPRQKIVRIKSAPSKCIWKTHTGDID
ncbi:Endonuclease/exonuclease/phosphatase protein [Spatholobus suberectus]|nr:Endonuclease/exonuclease/phosphatase protein [Spatholobus suberectus]